MTGSYRWPIMIGLLGIALVLVGSWTLVQGFGGWHATFQGPGTFQVDIPQAGDYRLWHESQTSIDGRAHRVDDELPSGTSIEVTDHQGQTIPIQMSSAKISQEVGSTRRVAVGEIEFPDSGAYNVAISGFDGTRSFRLSEIRFFEHFLRAVLFAIPGALLILLALLWIIIKAVRRRS